MSGRRFRRHAIMVAAAIALMAVAPGFAAALPGPSDPRGGDRDESYTSAEGVLRYQVHLPPPRPGGSTSAPPAVVVAIHGCAMTGFGLNSMKDTTRLDDLADREGFIVVYPTQSVLRNPQLYWNSLSPEHQHRGRGEPELIAGAVRQVVATHHADGDRVHALGVSSGAGTAVILGVTYPDLFATVTSVAGGEYGFRREFAEQPVPPSPAETAVPARAEMGPRARQVPLLVVQGDQDTTVPPVMAERLVQQWLALGELIEGRTPDASTPVRPDTTVHSTPPDGHAFETDTYRRPTTPGLVIQRVLIHGQGHAWSGPRSTGLFVDRRGPDLAAVMWDVVSERGLSG
ncbi:prolyl oligopeptidase family serine peptidase [Pseudonocardia sp. EV170527-09]|nr:prolyl oligopeptidase family serine peptidase [Pseudonocardia sp. EV170527-09]